MDLTTNELYKQIKKKSKNIIIEDIKPVLPSISIKARLSQVNQPKKEENIEKYFTMIILNESNISNFIYNSSLNQKIISCFNHLEYLSITNNYLINLNFIISFPDLFYLDVYGNPLEDFDALNSKTIFGYLRLTPEKFHEKNILSICGLNCSILDIDIKDKNVLRYFKINNPNIMMLNNEIIYYIDTLIEAETKRGTKKIKLERNSVVNTSNSNNISGSKNSNIDSNKINLYLDFKTDKRNQNKHQSHKIINFGFIKNQITTQLKQETKPGNLKLNNNNNNIINLKINNKSLLEIKNFFEELNQIITRISKKAKGNLKSQDLYEEQTYLKIEKKRILLLYQTYMKLDVFTNRKKNELNDIYVKNIEAINVNKFVEEIKIYEIKKYIKCININIRFGIIILISMLFYCLNLISMKMAITIIHYLLIKYYKFDEHKQFQYFNSFGNIHYLCYYLDNLEDYKTKLKFGEKSQIDLHQKILDILEVPKLILKLNKLYQKKNYFSKNKNIPQKKRVSTLLSDIKELKIEKEILILIEFFCDFIQYEDIEQKIINGSENDEYSTMIEIKEILEQNELEKNLYVQDLSVKKFYKNKLESTFNKFFFENDKIKIVKNKMFKNTNNNKKHFNRNKINLISFFNNWNQEYKKYDDINTKNCFTVDKCITKGKIKNIINKRLKNNKSSEFNKENSDFSEEKNCLSSGNNLSKNILFNHNINSKKSIFLDKEKELYFKTETSDNFYYRQKSGRIKGIKKMISDNQNLIGMFSTKNIFRKKNNSNDINDIVKARCQNNFKLYTNNSPNSKINSDETNKKKVLRNFLLNKTLRQKTLNKLKISEEKTDSLRIKKLNIKKEKEKETPYININAHRLYEKTKLNKTKKENNNFFNNDLLVEKYNQAKQSKIIRNILEKRNKLFQERLQKSKCFISTNKSNK